MLLIFMILGDFTLSVSFATIESNLPLQGKELMNCQGTKHTLVYHTKEEDRLSAHCGLLVVPNLENTPPSEAHTTYSDTVE